MNANDRPKFEFYRKSARKDIFLNKISWMPENKKMSIILNEKRRISERCSSPESQRRHLSKYYDTLRQNGYTKQDIDTISKKPMSHRTQATNPESTPTIFYLKVPFVNQKLNSKIIRIYQEEGFRVRISHQSTNLRQLLSKRLETNSCKMKNCVMNNKDCLKKNVVYLARCTECNSSYIGSTTRNLHQRIKEHFISTSSAIYKHSKEHRDSNQENWIFKIIASEKDVVDLRLKEGLLIAREKPKLNSREEMKQFAPFIHGNNS